MGRRVLGCILGLVWLAAAPGAGAGSRVPDGFEDVLVAAGLARPTAMAFLPDGRLLVAEQGGWLRLVEDEALLPTPFLRIAVDSSRERGLLGVAVDPRFPESPYVYAYYTLPGSLANRVSRFTLSAATPAFADPASERVLLDGIPSSHFHNGGALHFAADGTLFVAVGDALAPESAQSLAVLSGKLLRIGSDGSVPPDNPFVTSAGARPEVWAWGLRNPFTFAPEPGTGHLYINDVGDRGPEEINFGVAGANYGWPRCEGPCGNPAFQDPRYNYRHSDGCAITGGVFARGLRFPSSYEGDYFFSDFCGRWIRRLTADGREAGFASEIEQDAVDLDVGPDGQLYYLSFNAGALRRIEFVGAGNKRPVARAAVSPSVGPAPLQVLLSAEGSTDPDGGPLQFAWDFGDSSPAADGPVQLHTYASSGPYLARVTVSDPRGGRATASVRISVGDPPVARILTPPEGASFRPGDVIEYAGEASDPDTGPLSADALVWTIELHHHPETDRNHHVHPFEGPLLGATGRFQVPVELHDDDIFFRIRLSATDAERLTGEAVRDLHRRR